MDAKQFKCDICGLSYTKQPNLSRHQTKVHGNLAERKKLQRELNLSNELAIVKLQELISILQH